MPKSKSYVDPPPVSNHGGYLVQVRHVYGGKQTGAMQGSIVIPPLLLSRIYRGCPSIVSVAKKSDTIRVT
jgi:hypothetical protein